MKNLRNLSLIILMATLGFNGFAQDADPNAANVEADPSAATALSEPEIVDVIELLKFVRTAQPEEFNGYKNAFETVGNACASQKYDPNLEKSFEATVTEILNRLPDSNGRLLTLIRVGKFMGGDKVHKPTFTDKDHVLENTQELLEDIHENYSAQQFAQCAYLITRVDEAQGVSTERLASLQK